MPRTIQEVLDHAEELAERFENHDPARTMSVLSRSTRLSGLCSTAPVARTIRSLSTERESGTEVGDSATAQVCQPEV